MNRFSEEPANQDTGLVRSGSGDIAEAAETPLSSVGRELRSVRESRGLDLGQISTVLKIRKAHLAALEDDRIDKLPGRTYAIGFVRAYANYLGLDANSLTERFKGEILGRTDEPRLIQQTDAGPDRNIPLGWIVAGLVLVAAVGYGVYRLATPPDASTLPVAPVPQQQAEAVSKPPSAQTAPATTQSAPSSAAPDQAVTNTPSSAAPGAAPVTNPPAALPQLPPGQTYGQRNTDARVILRMHAAGFVSVKGRDGTVYISRNLQPGDSYKVPNHAGIYLNAANGAAVELDVDGAMAGMAAEVAGPVKDMALDAQTVASRHNAAAAH